MRDLVELNALELGAVAGRVGYPFSIHFAVPQHYSGGIEVPEEPFNGNGINNGDFDARQRQYLHHMMNHNVRVPFPCVTRTDMATFVA